MTNARRRRRRQRYVRYAAYVGPVVVVASTVAAIAGGGWWLLAGSATAALMSFFLALIVLKLDRRSRTDVTAARAALAAEYTAEQARYAEEHRSFTGHMVSLLDSATVRINILRRRVDALEREIAMVRFTQSTPPASRLDQSALGEAAAEWSQMWPDLAEAPTVVDLIKWDEKTRAELLGADRDDDEVLSEMEQDDRDEDQPQRRTA